VRRVCWSAVGVGCFQGRGWAVVFRPPRHKYPSSQAPFIKHVRKRSCGARCHRGHTGGRQWVGLGLCVAAWGLASFVVPIPSRALQRHHNGATGGRSWRSLGWRGLARLLLPASLVVPIPSQHRLPVVAVCLPVFSGGWRGLPFPCSARRKPSCGASGQAWRGLVNGHPAAPTVARRRPLAAPLSRCGGLLRTLARPATQRPPAWQPGA